MDKKHLITIRKDLGLIEIRFQRKIGAKDMISCLTELYRMEDFDPVMPTMYDFRECLAIGYRMEVVPFVKWLGELRSGLGKKKIGIVVDSLNQKFLVKVFIELAKGLDLEMKMFEDPKKCMSWAMTDFKIKNH